MKALSKADIDRLLGNSEPRTVEDGCGLWASRLSPDPVERDCNSDGHYLCIGCARLSGRKLGEILADNPQMRKTINRLRAEASAAGGVS